MPNVDPAAIVAEVREAISGIVRKDATTIHGFSERQLNMLARQATLIARAEVEGEFRRNPELREDFLANLSAMARNFAKALQGLAMVTVEKIWNAMVDILWKAIEGATTIRLPRPL